MVLFMVIHDFYVMGVFAHEAETDAVLLINADGILILSVSRQDSAEGC